MRSPFLFHADDRLSAAELAAARLDGHVVELGEAWIPADAVETAALRAGSLARLLGDTLAATHESAAWVHGALIDPPARHDVQRAVPQRLHRTFGRRFVYRDPEIDRADLVMIGGVRITTPVRTIVDLARTGEPSHAAALVRMVQWSPARSREALERVASSGAFPHKRAAEGAIRDALAVAVRTM